MTPVALRTGLATALLLRHNPDGDGVETLFDGLDDIGDIMDASAVASLFAPRHELAHVGTDRIRELLLAKAADA